MSTPQQALAASTPDSKPISPYQGLIPFSEEDAEYFFGREQETRLIISNLRAYSTTVLFGPSGVGKSSVLRAGVIRALMREQEEAFARFGGRESVTCYVARWQDAPLRMLATAIRESLAGADAGAVVDLPVDELDVETVISRCAALDVDLLLILDQFEEYFYYHAAEPENDLLAEALGRLVAPATRVNVLLCLREDSIAALDRFEVALPGLFNNSLRLEHLDPEACRAAIQGPLDVYNSRPGTSEPRWDVDQALVERLLVELRAGRVRVGGNPTQDRDTDDGEHSTVATRVEAPYLQLVLTRLWDEERSSGSHVLRESTLAALGGSQAVVEDHLNRVLADLDSAELDVVAKAFSYLVTPSGTKIAHRPSDLASWTGVRPERMRRLLDQLARGERVIMRRVPPPLDDPTGEPRFEVFHDVLAVAILDWTARHDAVVREEHLIAERDQAARETRQTHKRLVVARAVIAGMVALLLACGGLAFLAWNNAKSAEKEESRANVARLLAQSEQLAAADPNAALGKAIEAWQQDDEKTRDTAEPLRSAVSANHARLILPMGDTRTRVILSEFIGDGDQILTVSSDSHVRLWSASDAELEFDRDFAAELGSEPVSAAVLADGSGAVVGGSEGIAVRVPFDGDKSIAPADVGDGWVSVLSGGAADRSVFVAHTAGSPAHVFVSPDYDDNELGPAAMTVGLDPTGALLATWTDLDGELSLLDLSTSETRGTATLQDDWVPVIDINASGVVGAGGSGYYDGETEADVTASLYLWDGVTTSRPRNVPLLASHAISALTFSDDGSQVLLTGDKRSELIDVETTDWLQIAPELTDWALASQLSPNNDKTVSAGRDGNVSVFSTYTIRTGTYLDLPGHSGAVNDVAFNSRGDEIVTGADDGTARVWQLPKTTVLDIGEWILEAQPTSDGSRVAAVTSDHQIVVADAATGEWSWWNSLPWRYHDQQASDVAWDPDGRRLVVTATDQFAPYVVSEHAAHPMPLEEPMGYSMVSVDWSPIADHVAAGDAGGVVGLWDVDTGELLWQTPLAPNQWDLAYSVNGIAFTAEGDVVAAAWDGTIWVLSHDDGEIQREIRQSGGRIINAAISSDGRYLGTVSDDWHMRVWDLYDDSETPIVDRRAHDGSVFAIAFGAEGSEARMATGGADGTVRVYDIPTGDLLAVLDVHGDAVNSVAFDPTEPNRIVAASDDGTVTVTQCDLCDVVNDKLLNYAQRSQAHIG
jgi:WD40 repeat protein